MDWFKRHWVDALMVALIVAVVGGVLALLLRGSGFGASPPSVTAAQPLKPPASSSTVPPAASPTTTTAAPSSQSTPPAPVVAVVAQPPAAAPPAKPVEIAAIPAMATAPSSAKVQPTAPAAQPSAVTPASPKRPQPANAQREPLNYARADFLRNYRVAIATYSSATRAQSSAARLRSLGYPAQAFSSGSGYIVVAGPYARESSARNAFNKLRAQGYSDAVLYSPNGNRERSANVDKPVSTPGGGGSSPAQLVPELSYLQVGAFKTMRSALPLLERLRGSGFKTLLRSASDGYTRVLVGPFSAALLSDAKQNLSGQGLTPFAVKQ